MFPSSVLRSVYSLVSLTLLLSITFIGVLVQRRCHVCGQCGQCGRGHSTFFFIYDFGLAMALFYFFTLRKKYKLGKYKLKIQRSAGVNAGIFNNLFRKSLQLHEIFNVSLQRLGYFAQQTPTIVWGPQCMGLRLQRLSPCLSNACQ